MGIENGRIYVSVAANPIPPDDIVAVRVWFDVSNLGNTPSGDAEMVIDLVTPASWRFITFDQKVKSSNQARQTTQLVSIGQRGRDDWDRIFHFYVPMGEVKSGKSYAYQYVGLLLKGKITYLDIFGDSHTVDWCWRHPMKDLKSLTAWRCDPREFDAWREALATS